MRSGTTLAAFAAVLTVAFGAGAAIGAAAGPIDVGGPDSETPTEAPVDTIVGVPAHEGH